MYRCKIILQMRLVFLGNALTIPIFMYFHLQIILYHLVIFYHMKWFSKVKNSYIKIAYYSIYDDHVADEMTYGWMGISFIRRHMLFWWYRKDHTKVAVRQTYAIDRYCIKRFYQKSFYETILLVLILTGIKASSK